MFWIDRKDVESNAADAPICRRMRDWSVAGGLALAAIGGVQVASAASFSPEAPADALTKSTVYEQPAALSGFSIDHPPECMRGTEDNTTDFRCELMLGDLKTSGNTGTEVSFVPATSTAARVYGSAPDGILTEPIEGSVQWSTVTDKSGEKTLVGHAAIDKVDLTVTVEISRNADAALSAKQVVKMTIHAKEGAVVALPTVFARQGDAAEGTKLRGASVHIIDNVFLFGLNAGPADQTANIDLLARANWLDLPMQFASGRRQLVSLALDSIAHKTLNKLFDETAKR